MTKAELIEAMKHMPDDMEVNIWCGFDHRDPAGGYSIKKVFRSCSVMNCILIEPEDE